MCRLVSMGCEIRDTLYINIRYIEDQLSLGMNVLFINYQVVITVMYISGGSR